jgi:GMP synthase-like glutamine amidotransferase
VSTVHPRILLLSCALAPTATDGLISLMHPHDMIDVVELKEHLPPLDLRNYAATIAVAGPGYDEEEGSYGQVSTLARQAIEEDRVLLVIGRGAEIVATALGGSIIPSRMQFGLREVHLTKEGLADLLHQGIGGTQMVFLCQQHRFDLPPGAVRLAGNESTPNQALRVGRWMYGLQDYFVSAPSLAHWLAQPAVAQQLADELSEEAFHRALLNLAQSGWFQIYERQAKKLFANFLSLVRRRASSQ